MRPQSVLLSSVERRRLAIAVLALTIPAACLGFMLMLLDSAQATQRDRIAQRWSTTELVVEKPSGSAGLRQEDIRQIADLAGVRHAEGGISDTAISLVKAGASPLHTLTVSVSSAPGLRWEQLSGGRLPVAAGEIVVDEAGADRHGWRLGSRIDATRHGGEPVPHALTLVGTIRNQAPAPYQALVGVARSGISAATGGGEYSRILVSLEPGMTHARAAQQIRAEIPGSVVVSQRDLIARDVAQQDWHELTPYVAGISIVVVLVGVLAATLVLRRMRGESPVGRRRRLIVGAGAGSVSSVIGLGVSFCAAIVGRAVFDSAGVELNTITIQPGHVALLLTLTTATGFAAAALSLRSSASLDRRTAGTPIS